MSNICNNKFVLIFIFVLMTSFKIGSSQERTKLVDKHVYMHYMPWFDSPEYHSGWQGHWSMANMDPNVIIDDVTGKREIASHYYPLIGAYDSQDPDVIEYHLLLMKHCGIDGILMNWYGTIGTNGDIDVLLENSNTIVDASEALDMDFSVIMEDRFVGTENGLNPVDYVYINIEYLKENYFTRPNFIRTEENKPFFGIFGPLEISSESDWNYALSAAGEEVIFLPLFWDKNRVGPAAGGGYDWVLEDGIEASNYFYQSVAPILDFSMGCAYSGFNDFYEEGGWGTDLFTLDPEDGELFHQTLQLAKDNADDIDALQLITWNDFGEGTMLEPTYEFGFEYLTLLQSQLGVSYGEYELQQIYRLYQLRKTHHTNDEIQAQLDQARTHFINKNQRDAIAIMDDVERADDDTYYLIKNRYNGQYLYQNTNQVWYGDLKEEAAFYWKMEVATDGFFYIKNAMSDDKINIENRTGVLECGQVSMTAESSMWEKRTIDGTHMRLLNRWVRDQYINIEHEMGVAEHSTSERSWSSGHWILEEVDNPTKSMDSYANKLSVFPNPSANMVTVQSSYPINNIDLYNMTGKILKIDYSTDSYYSVSFHVEDLKTGLYYIKVRDEFNETVTKLMVE